jgi:AraC-like DNA-binding protein
MKYRSLLILLILVTVANCEIPGIANTPATAPRSIIVDSWTVSFENVALKEDLSAGAVWKNVTIPGTFRLSKTTPARIKYIWLRGYFTIDNNPEDYYGISLGRIYHSDLVFINNSPVGGKSSKDFFELHFPRDYTIHPGTLKKGMNEVLIRVGIFSDQFGGLTDRVRIMTMQDYEEKSAQDTFIFLLIPSGLLTLYIGFLALLFLLFYFNRGEPKLIYSSIGLFFYIIMILVLFFPYQATLFSVPLEIQLSIQITILKILIPSFIIVLIFIIQSHYRIRFSRYHRIAIVSVSIILVMIIINAAIFSNPLRTIFNTALLSFVAITGTVYLGFMTYKFNTLQSDQVRKRMISAMIFMAGLTIIWEGTSYVTGGTTFGIVAVFISPAIITIFLMLFVKDYIEKQVEMGVLYNKLKKPAAPETGSNDDRHGITESSEEKLKRVIAFIEENFTSDISREGLAAAVDLNPNYMSRLFMTYTGKKISDYINELRIKSTIEKIEKGDMLILDIALEAGFESLSTFNRAFKKITGTTPSDYKKSQIL